jgi:hypothetical protein
MLLKRVYECFQKSVTNVFSAGGYAGVAPEPPPMPGVFIAVGLIPARRAYSCTADEYSILIRSARAGVKIK